MTSPAHPDHPANHRSALLTLLDALQQIESTRFLRLARQAPTAVEFFDVTLALGYAANSKELRDTGDERVHQLCEAIRTQVHQLFDILTIKILPNSAEQAQRWARSAQRDPAAKYAFRDDGSLEISLLDATLRSDTLHITRLWNHVCNHTGDRVGFAIQLERDQIERLQLKFAQAAQACSVIDQSIRQDSAA